MKHMKRNNVFRKKFIIEGIDTSVIEYLFENCGYYTLFRDIKRLYKTNNGYSIVIEEPIYKLLYYKIKLRKINRVFKKHYTVSLCNGLRFN